MKRPLVKKKSRQQKPRRSKLTAELLFEIGMEELPFEFVASALTALRESATRLFQDARLSCGSIKTYGTPRRLVVIVDELLAHQTAVVKETMGPSKMVAFDQAGQPTKAAMGFAAGQGVTVEGLEIRSTPKGEYLFAVKRDAGRKTATLLPELLPHLFETLSFPKAMKWNETGVRFARPVRWIMALFGGKVVPVQIAGIHAGNWTSGHRVMGSKKPITVRDFKSYSKSLEKLGVMLDPERRRAAIQQQIDRLCVKAGVGLNADDSLLDQAVYTTEWPCAVLGSFKPEYLAVPSEILITSMKEHQGFFSVRDKKSGKLAPHFIAIANNEPKNMALIRAGNERVLAARLADAKFFFDEDRKVTLEERGKKLTGVTFHQRLGTMAQKQERIRKLAAFIAARLDGGQAELQQVCDRAAALSKADLLTGIVGEFPELQGIMGGEYALHDGESTVVAQAIREQYLPKAIEGELPKTLVGQILSLADRLDSIASFFHVGIVPTGSEDPFALRRHATAIVRIVLEGKFQIDLRPCIDHAMDIVSNDGFKGVQDLEQQGRRRITEFVFERVRHYVRIVQGLRDDVIDSVLKSAYDKSVGLVDLVQKMKAIEEVTRKPEFDPLIVGFKRAHRLVEKEQWERQPVDPAKFQDASESILYNVIKVEGEKIGFALSMGDYHEALNYLVGLRTVIDAFFEAVMVNAEDKAIRSNRLTLLKEVDELFMSFADFSQVVVQGR
ncbi:MAG: glycine--tRNA ligase subunit beta [Nitrospira sp.]|nr:glycine--tRNA ligase subunit beta [Nitrospira sp.]MDH4251123.1 glycine--tRNA ligase subunit beta [Nitrospira sp.]MDH4343135.1 glycine--tRNA ligase subunit beta [Nitrospira sp.]MDH5336132.1 glycine--tRNA ligase subunit beta [Nitrospira sp.]